MSVIWGQTHAISMHHVVTQLALIDVRVLLGTQEMGDHALR